MGRTPIREAGARDDPSGPRLPAMRVGPACRRIGRGDELRRLRIMASPHFEMLRASVLSLSGAYFCLCVIISMTIRLW